MESEVIYPMRNSKDLSDFVVGVIALCGGKVAGKTRLQKTVYLIQRLTETNFFRFGYHYYGPYSVDLVAAVDGAQDGGRIQADMRVGYYNIPYVMYKTDERTPDRLAGRSVTKIRGWLKKFDEVDTIVLELAATWLFLRCDEGIPTNKIQPLLRQLKPQKATDDRLNKALSLLKSLNLVSQKSPRLRQRMISGRAAT